MSSDRRIPIPFRHRVRRFQYSVLPAVIFIASLAVTCWLWDRQRRLPNAVGEVEVERVPVVAGVDGTLLHVGPPGMNRTWNLFERVEQGRGMQLASLWVSGVFTRKKPPNFTRSPKYAGGRVPRGSQTNNVFLWTDNPC